MAWKGCVVKWAKAEFIKRTHSISRSSRHYCSMLQFCVAGAVPVHAENYDQCCVQCSFQCHSDNKDLSIYNDTYNMFEGAKPNLPGETEFDTTPAEKDSLVINFYNQQRCGFHQEVKKPEIKKGNVTQQTKPSPSEAGAIDPPPPPILRRPTLFRPLMFTVGFTGCSFGAAAILQYETLKSRVRTAKDGEELEKFALGSQDMAYWHDWWNHLSGFQRQLILLVSKVDDFWNSLTEGQRTVTGIIALNAAVLCCWRIPSMQRTMVKYFMSNPASKTRCLPMILSCFSHYSVFHMVANMYVLWMFSSGIVSLLGKEQFLAVYLSAGVISTMVSYVCKTATGRFYPSLGASGAVMAVLAAVCTKAPEAELGIIFLPMVTFSAGNALKALMAIDTAGLMLGWRFFDHASHLGGALFGIWYVMYGHKLIWTKREPLVKLWHDTRSSGSRGSGSDSGGPGHQ